MNENVSLSTYEEYCSFEQQYMQPQKVPEGCSFWMIRSKRGVFYDEYIRSGYIAIGWNALLERDFATDSENQRKTKIAIAYPSEQRPTGCVNKCNRFINEMKPGDIAVVVGNGKVAFCIVGIYYEENIENPIQKELEANAQIAESNYKELEIHCPYQKRRYIQCIREVQENRVNPVLGRAISNRHSLSDMNEYSTDILSECFDFFEYNKQTHVVFRVTAEEKIDAKALSRFMFISTEMLAGRNNPSISAKTNLNSPGTIHFVIESVEFIKNNPGIFVLMMVGIFGGKIKLPGVELEIPSLRSGIASVGDGITNIVGTMHKAKMYTQEEKLAQANVRKANAEAAQSELDAILKLSQLGQNTVLSSEEIQKMYLESSALLQLSPPNLTKVDFPKEKNSGDSDEVKTLQKKQ